MSWQELANKGGAAEGRGRLAGQGQAGGGAGHCTIWFMGGRHTFRSKCLFSHRAEIFLASGLSLMNIENQPEKRKMSH